MARQQNVKRTGDRLVRIAYDLEHIAGWLMDAGFGDEAREIRQAASTCGDVGRSIERSVKVLPRKANPISTFRKLWDGQYPLAVVFWGVYVLGGFVLWTLASAPVLLLSYRLDVNILGFLIVLRALYFITAAVVVWRSASAYYVSSYWIERVWAIGARVLVCGWTFSILFENPVAIMNRMISSL
jgi:hypothetical protein